MNSCREFLLGTPAAGLFSAGRSPLPVWRDADVTVVAGILACPNGGATVEEKPCRKAMDAVHLTSTVENQVCPRAPVHYDYAGGTVWIGIGR